MSSALVPKDGDWYVKVSSVTDAKSGDAITDATVTVNLQTLAGQAVSGAQDLSAAYDSPTAAYWATVPHTASVVLGHRYKVQVVATKGGLQVPFYHEVVVVQFPA